MHISSLFLTMILTISRLGICHARDTITKTTPLKDDNETITSSGKKFELGFFTPANSDGGYRYVGIWYYELQPRTIVWVANGDRFLSPGSQEVVFIADNGNLQVADINITTRISSTTSNTTAKLLDTGNLVLLDNKSGKTLWQSFEHPTDTFLPGMFMTPNLELTSWMNESTPGTGIYKFKKDQEEKLYVIKENDQVYWKGGEPGGQLSTSEMPNLITNFLTNLSGKSPGFLTFRNTTIELNLINITARLVLNSYGVLQFFNYSEPNIWEMIWLEPQNNCSIYNACGEFGICKNVKDNKEKECSCLDGFTPVSSDEWQSGQYNHGCKRKTNLCNKITSRRETFLNLTSVKLGSTSFPLQGNISEVDCKNYCLGGCECQAYSFFGGKVKRGTNSTAECRIWKSDLQDLHENVPGGRNLSVRIAISDINSANQPNTTTPEDPTRKNTSHIKQRVLIISTTIIATIVIICIFSYLFYRRNITRSRRDRTSTRNTESLQPTAFITASPATATTEGNIRKSIDVSFFKFQTILVATDNFSEANKLGEGGFGPVYRGIFGDKQYLAVKRLSSSSGQGIEEFQNEVALIAKLQHRNLVRVLGYCVDKDERVLLYEYMPNKSLDNFIFNQKQTILLDWKKRFEIILGIARGLLYLHQDSRLRIIHRDLKTSNILLDDEMNPKISDFGLARIVQGKQTEVNTNRVVGTYGYMSPEYALEGLFSIKSDVFSFGVITLEIISGKRNTGFYQSKEALNLLGYAWKLWEAKKQWDLLDEALKGCCDKNEVFKCVNVGLLCVQENPSDRPTMGNVVIMLGSESTNIPNPSQPAFIERRSLPSTSSSSSAYREAASFNKLTVTVQEGR